MVYICTTQDNPNTVTVNAASFEAYLRQRGEYASFNMRGRCLQLGMYLRSLQHPGGVIDWEMVEG